MIVNTDVKLHIDKYAKSVLKKHIKKFNEPDNIICIDQMSTGSIHHSPDNNSNIWQHTVQNYQQICYADYIVFSVYNEDFQIIVLKESDLKCLNGKMLFYSDGNFLVGECVDRSESNGKRLWML